MNSVGRSLRLLVATAFVLGLTIGVASLAPAPGTARATSSFTSVSNGPGLMCALDASGVLGCSGTVETIPEGPFLALSRDAPACGIDADRRVECWTGNHPPDGAFVQVASFGNTCAVRESGQLSCWGPNDLAFEAGDSFRQVSVGSGYACAVTTGGAIECVGRNDVLQASPPAGMYDVVDAGSDSTCAVATDQSILCWGASYGLGSAPAGLTGTFTDVSVASDHACALRTDATATCWGNNGNGQALPPPGTWIAISASDRSTCGIRTNGELECWGSLATPFPDEVVDVDVGGFDCSLQLAGSADCGLGGPPTDRFSDVDAGYASACGVRAGDTASISCTGVFGDPGSLECTMSGCPKGRPNVAPAGEYVAVEVGDFGACALSQAGTVSCWGPTLSRAPSGQFAQVAVGDRFACGRRASGAVECWSDIVTPGIAVPPDAHFTDVTAGRRFGCGIRTDGTAACWGDNKHGRAFPPDGTFTDVDAGAMHACGVRSDESISCWGDGDYGRLDPTLVPLGTFDRVAAGDTSNCAIRTDTTLVCWGSRTASVDGPLLHRSDEFSRRSFDPVAPSRLVETRQVPGFTTADGRFAGIGRIGAGEVLRFVAAGRGGIAADAAAAVLTVTAIRPDGRGHLTAYPCDQPRPVASNLNYGAGDVVPNSVLVSLSARGEVCIYSHAATDLVIDANASVPASGSPLPMGPARLAETRVGPEFTTVDGHFEGVGRLTGGRGSQRFGSTITIDVWGRGGVPHDAHLVWLNVAAIRPDERGHVIVFPCDGFGGPPSTSSLNYDAGEVVANTVITAVGPTGKICVHTWASTDLIVDVLGAARVEGTPIASGGRLLDTRRTGRTIDGEFQGTGTVAAAASFELGVAGRSSPAGPIIPADASAVVVNLTAVAAAGRGHATVYPCDHPRPHASSVNFEQGEAVANAVVVPLSADGSICIWTSTESHFVADLSAYVIAP